VRGRRRRCFPGAAASGTARVTRPGVPRPGDAPRRAPPG